MTNLANAMSVDWLMRIGVYDENGQFNKNRTWKTLGQGAATHIIAAFDESIIPESGSYLVDGTVHDDLALPHAKDMESAKKLWTLNEQLVGEEFSI
ncbi:hypothetical protein BOTBODRAFT_35067 [Botryobasidium botryosum FD-172 SS1]|uniref:Uncharacterized protein n=1 Tax=Botryobasidium botryosum (strain FD-172 SS1) TaxID=930990 RepID=A0A067MIZ7_BOTB1|nr:hypothetical protein BOTBODRAFT_35067 [Botryobasidium botryosum FD-172 SS1]